MKGTRTRRPDELLRRGRLGTNAKRFAAAFACLLIVNGSRTSAEEADDRPKIPLAPSFVLPANLPSQAVPLRWANGWVLAQVRISGADAGWFKIATGWRDSKIDPAVAVRLGLREISPRGLLVNAIPTNEAPPKHYRVEQLQCGMATASDLRLVATDLTAMSRASIELYGEPISGVLGWDLLRTLPFVLDEPKLQLLWLAAVPAAEGAVRQPMIEKNGCPFIETTLGDGFKVWAMLNSAGATVPIRRALVKANPDRLWKGPPKLGTWDFFLGPDDDDALPIGEIPRLFPHARWLKVECGGQKIEMTATIAPPAAEVFGDVQLGYELLRRTRVVFDGPGKSFWLVASDSSVELEVLRQASGPRAANLAADAFVSAIGANDPGAVKAMIAAGIDAKGRPEAPWLAIACDSNAREAATALIEAGAPVDSPPKGPAARTPLESACIIGEPGLIRMLLAKGADPNRMSARGMTPLIGAARSGNPAAVKALLSKARFPSEPNAAAQLLSDACLGGDAALAKEALARIPEKLRSQMTWHVALEASLLLGRVDTVDWLLKQGGPGIASKNSNLPSLLAAILPVRMEKTDAVRERLVKSLLAAGADPNASRNGITPLLLAARHGNAEIVRILLAAGAKPTAKDFKSRDALLRAAAANQPVEVIAPLLKAGLDLDSVDSVTELTALATYAKHGNAAACRALLDAGAGVDAHSMFGPAPLCVATNGLGASDEEVLAVVKLLLERGAKPESDKNSPDIPGPLFGAVLSGRASLIKSLLEAGAGLEAKVANITPLGLACVGDNPESVKVLLERGANPNAIDSQGITPLGHAAAAGNCEAIALLLKHGVSPDATDPSGVPPLWLAATCGQTRAVRLLLAAGAKRDAVHPTQKSRPLDVAKTHDDTVIAALLELPAD